MTVFPACFRCKHLRPPSGDWVMRCDAFPGEKGIPDVMLEGKNDHKGPLPGDRGIRFEARDEAGP